MKKTSGVSMMGYGALATIIGIIITGISYSQASAVAESGGIGHYTIFTGLIVVGIIYFIIGFFKMLAGK
jgi:hypothetical protein